MPDTPEHGSTPGTGLDTEAFAPQPVSPRLRRWLPVDPAAPLVGLRVVSAGGPSASAEVGFTVEALPALLARWPDARGAVRGHVPVPVLVADADIVPTLRRLLHGRSGLVVQVPGSPRRSALLNALAAVVKPPTASDASAWELEARSSGVPVYVLGQDVDAPALGYLMADTERLGDEGRRARLSVLRSSPARDTVAGTPAAPPPGPESRVTVEVEPRRVVVAGHDLKFARGLIDHLAGLGHDVRLDEWTGHQRHDPARSRQLARWADSVLCEWALGNAVWYAEHAPPGTRLTTRLHLQEAALDYPGLVRRGRMDRFVFVADHVRRQVIRDHRIDPALTTVVPNAVHVPPQPPARAGSATRATDRAFTLGLVGMTPARKGLHRALDLLAELRGQDRRFTLRIKGHLPSDQAWMAARTHEAAYYRRHFARMEADPSLRGAVHLDDFGHDMDGWYAGIGFALSTSDFESFHFTLPDGAAHGAVPVSLAWPGADGLYPVDWLHASVPDMAGTIRRLAGEPGARAEASARARDWVESHFDARRVLPALAREVLGG
ncbi:hypothetical protein E7744_09370 [Citricoccus sp. SGAir0253]|uniref:glycosyltransferase family 4 protein n=1 Tax=Citricoccus sp. SGAir0253 TaxID=2567881 RepID=UPI0010CCB6A2|nr:glycosyltransferase family 4 protein [Citricoccus sp. SGAir0253]QCU78351.1 hypothetical protein E7744_09370 [Citricoccus sp. SGAir0253]